MYRSPSNNMIHKDKTVQLYFVRHAQAHLNSDLCTICKYVYICIYNIMYAM